MKAQMSPLGKKTVFDVDDILWDMNGRVAKRTGIDYKKFTSFSVYENPNVTDAERRQILSLYMDSRLFTDIPFNDRIVKLVNRIYHEYPEFPVHISSNNSTKEIRDLKMEQLLSVLDLPEERIHLHVVNVETESCQKKFPDDIFLVADDSPHNIEMANAVHKIMPARPWNNVLVNGCLNGCKVDRPQTDTKFADTVLQYLENAVSVCRKK